MKKRKRPRSTAEILDAGHSGLGATIRVSAALKQAWISSVGEQLAEISWPMRQDGRYLEIGVRDPAWIQELDLLAPQILDRLRARIPYLKAQRLRCRVVQAKEISQPTTSQDQARSPKPQPNIDPERIASIRDPELRARFEALLHLGDTVSDPT